MFDKNLRLVAVDKETQECYTVDSIHFPLGKPSGKDIAVISNDDYDLLEWRSIDEVAIYKAGIDLGEGEDKTVYPPVK